MFSLFKFVSPLSCFNNTAGTDLPREDTYYIAFPNDRWLAKLLVYGIFVCEAVQTLIISHDTFQVFVVNFGDLHSMDLMHTNWFSIPIVGGISASFSLSTSSSAEFFFQRGALGNYSSRIG